MNFFKSIRIMLLGALTAACVAPMGSVSAMAAVETQVADACNFVKSIYTFDYLKGENTQNENASFLQNISNHPDRALITVAVYGLSLFAAKKLYDLANKYGVFDEINKPAHGQPTGNQQQQRPRVYQPNQPRVPGPRYDNQYQDYRDQQRQRYEERLDQDNYNNADNQNDYYNQPHVRHNNVPIANPFPGRQLHILRPRPGFYHMTSNTPYHAIHDACGVNAAYNMAQLDARTFGRRFDEHQFQRIQQAVFPAMGYRGASDDEVVQMANRLGLPAVLALHLQQNGLVAVGIPARDHRAAAEQGIRQRAQEFIRTQGARTAHFLCGVPGHWVSISVIRLADGSQAMYLYDNMNEHTHAPDALEYFVDTLYNSFF